MSNSDYTCPPHQYPPNQTHIPSPTPCSYPQHSHSIPYAPGRPNPFASLPATPSAMTPPLHGYSHSISRQEHPAPSVHDVRAARSGMLDTMSASHQYTQAGGENGWIPVRARHLSAFLKLAITLAIVSGTLSTGLPLLKIVGLSVAPALQSFFTDKWTLLGCLVWAALWTTITLCKALWKGPLLAICAVITFIAITAFAFCLWQKLLKESNRTNDRRFGCLFIVVGVALDAILNQGTVPPPCPPASPCEAAHACTMQALLLFTLYTFLEAIGLVLHLPWSSHVLKSERTNMSTIVAVVLYWCGVVFLIAALILAATGSLEKTVRKGLNRSSSP